MACRIKLSSIRGQARGFDLCQKIKQIFFILEISRKREVDAIFKALDNHIILPSTFFCPLLQLVLFGSSLPFATCLPFIRRPNSCLDVWPELISEVSLYWLLSFKLSGFSQTKYRLTVYFYTIDQIYHHL